MNARSLTLASLALLLLAAPASAALAQTPVDPGPRRWSAVRIGKWALLGAAAGFAAWAVSHTSRAEESYVALERTCTVTPERCEVVDGRYADAALERLYDETARHDRQAQTGIIGAQASLFGSVGLFIWDLRNDRGPGNLPYPSHARRAPGRAIAVGARIAF